MKKRGWWLVAGCLWLVVVAGCTREEKAAATAPEGRGAPAQTATGNEPGAMMPEYSAMNLDGTKFELASRRDKVVLLNLWATWCPPCRAEIPELQRIHDEYGRRGFEVIGVSLDEGGIETVREFTGQYKMTYPVVLDAQGKAADVLAASVLPTTVLIGRDGRIVWKKVGPIFEGDQELRSAIEKAL